MEKTVTFGKLLSLMIIIAMPFSYWIYSVENRFGETKTNYELINIKVLNAIDKVNNSLHNIEHSLSEKDTLNYYISNDN